LRIRSSEKPGEEEGPEKGLVEILEMKTKIDQNHKRD
jgi:hypothetical protein